MSERISGKNAMIVKSSGGSFIDCNESGNGWIAMEYSGKLLKDELGKPTREWVLHRTLLENIERCMAIVHTHSPFLIAWADKHEYLPLVTWHSRLKIGCEIPVIDVPSAVVPELEACKIQKIFEADENLPAVILKGHGVVAIGKNAVAAEHLIELLEETAQIAVLQKILN